MTKKLTPGGAGVSYHHQTDPVGPGKRLRSPGTPNFDEIISTASRLAGIALRLATVLDKHEPEMSHRVFGWAVEMDRFKYAMKRRAENTDRPGRGADSDRDSRRGRA